MEVEIGGVPLDFYPKRAGRHLPIQRYFNQLLEIDSTLKILMVPDAYSANWPATNLELFLSLLINICNVFQNGPANGKW